MRTVSRVADTESKFVVPLGMQLGTPGVSTAGAPSLARAQSSIERTLCGTRFSWGTLSVAAPRKMAVEMSTQRREFFRSPNGDRWYLCRSRSGHVMVLREGKGGHTMEMEVSEVLRAGNRTPERAALLHLIGELVSPADFPSDFPPH
jgi:hypothetical protein